MRSAGVSADVSVVYTDCPLFPVRSSHHVHTPRFKQSLLVRTAAKSPPNRRTKLIERGDYLPAVGHT